MPVYTKCLTTDQYGISDLINTTVALLIPIFTIDIQDAVLRFVMDKKYKKEDVFTTALSINIIGLTLVAILSFLLFKINIFNMPNYFYIYLIIFYAITAFSNSINLFCKGIDKVKNIVIGTIINSIITITCNILFLVVFKWGINGFLIANCIGSVISLVYIILTTKLYDYIKIKMNKELTKKMIIYSFPLIFSVIAWWVNSASDRYIITWLAGVSASGIYAIAYKIPNLLSIFQNIFTQAWSISAIKDFDHNDTDGFIGNMYTMMNFSMCIVCSFIITLNVFVSKWLYSGDFSSAWIYVPPLLVSVVFNAMALFIGSIFTAAKDTKTLSISTISGALINTILNFILIKLYGVYGAAIATMVGYAVILTIRYITMKKHIKLKTNNYLHLLTYILLIIQMTLAYFGNKYILLQIFIMFTILFIYRKFIKYIHERIKRITEGLNKQKSVN